MAEEPKKEEAEAPAEGTPEGATPADQPAEPPKKSPLLLILAIVIPIVLLGGAAAVIFLTSFGRQLVGLDKGAHKPKGVELPAHIDYYDIPEMLVNIQSTAKRKPFLRLSIKLELHNPDDKKTLDLVKPRLIDAFQVYLRELRTEDLEGSSGSQRLKEELLKRANTVAAPAKISDVLIGTFVVQ